MGRVISLNYKRTEKPKFKTLKEKKTATSTYFEVILTKNKRNYTKQVARLVAEHFIENPMQKPKVIHISEDISDNRASNLMWAYESEKNHHTINRNRRKERPSYTKITYKGKNYFNYYDIARDYGLNIQTFSSRINRQKWSLYEAIEIPVRKHNKQKI
jgi:hypothetical protein